MDDISEAREYAKKNGIKLTHHKNGDVSIKFKKTHRGGSYSNFEKEILRLMRGIERRLRDFGYEYVPDPRNYGGQYPEKIIRATFSKNLTH